MTNKLLIIALLCLISPQGFAMLTGQTNSSEETEENSFYYQYTTETLIASLNAVELPHDFEWDQYIENLFNVIKNGVKTWIEKCYEALPFSTPYHITNRLLPLFLEFINPEIRLDGLDTHRRLACALSLLKYSDLAHLIRLNQKTLAESNLYLSWTTDYVFQMANAHWSDIKFHYFLVHAHYELIIHHLDNELILKNNQGLATCLLYLAGVLRTYEGVSSIEKDSEALIYKIMQAMDPSTVEAIVHHCLELANSHSQSDTRNEAPFHLRYAHKHLYFLFKSYMLEKDYSYAVTMIESMPNLLLPLFHALPLRGERSLDKPAFMHWINEQNTGNAQNIVRLIHDFNQRMIIEKTLDYVCNNDKQSFGKTKTLQWWASYIQQYISKLDSFYKEKLFKKLLKNLDYEFIFCNEDTEENTLDLLDCLEAYKTDLKNSNNTPYREALDRLLLCIIEQSKQLTPTTKSQLAQAIEYYFSEKIDELLKSQDTRTTWTRNPRMHQAKP